MLVSDNLSPRRMIPARSSFFAEKSIPGERASGRWMTLVRSTPSTIAMINALTPGRNRLIP